MLIKRLKDRFQFGRKNRWLSVVISIIHTKGCATCLWSLSISIYNFTWFHIILDAHTMKKIICTCIILYNLIVKNKRHVYQNHIDYDNKGNDMSTNEIFSDTHFSFKSRYLQRRTKVHDREKYYQKNTINFKQIWLRIFENVLKNIIKLILCNTYFFNIIVFNYLLLCKIHFILTYFFSMLYDFHFFLIQYHYVLCIFHYFIFL